MGQGQDPKARRRPLEISSRTTDLMSPDNPEIILRGAPLPGLATLIGPGSERSGGGGWGEATRKLPLTP